MPGTALFIAAHVHNLFSSNIFDVEQRGWSYGMEKNTGMSGVK